RSMEAKYRSMEEKYGSMQEKYETLTKQMEHERMQQKSLLEEMDRISGELENTVREQEQLNDVLVEMQNSRSWRLTKPLRFIGSKVRRVKRKVSKLLALIFKYPFKMNLIPMQ